MSDQPRVLTIGPGPNVRGGITAVILSYARQVTGAGHRFEWLSTYDDRGPLAKLTAAMRAFVLAWGQIPRHDIIHIHAAWGTSFYRKTIFFAMAKCFGKKTILHLHAPDFHDFRQGLLRIVSQRVFSGADVVIALSEAWARDVRAMCPGANVKVVPNPCEIPARCPRRLVDREPIVLFSGKLEPRKGFADLIRAMPAILAQVPEARLVMAGHGAVEEAKAITARLGIAERVECLGWITGAKKAEVLSASRIFCLPSYGEGLPMAMLEAMSYGIPVVVTPVGGIPEIVTDGHSGRIVKPGDVSGISGAVASLLLDTDSAQRLAETALAIVKAQFWPDRVHVCVRQLYDDLLDGSNNATTARRHFAGSGGVIESGRKTPVREMM